MKQKKEGKESKINDGKKEKEGGKTSHL